MLPSLAITAPSNWRRFEMKKPPLGGSGQEAKSDLNLPATNRQRLPSGLGDVLADALACGVPPGPPDAALDLEALEGAPAGPAGVNSGPLPGP